MSTVATINPDPLNPASPEPDTGIVLPEDTEPRDMTCPVCGSGSTYQTQGGRWGCVQCGSMWG